MDAPNTLLHATDARARWLRHAPPLAALVVALIGLVAILGWLFKPTMLQVLPAPALMRFNTAGAFVLAGLSLWTQQQRARGWRWCGRVCAVVVALCGLLTLGEILSGRNLWLDELLFRMPASVGGVAQGPRMAPQGAFCLLIAGLALLLVKQRSLRAQQVAHALTLLLLFIGLLALTNISYGVSYTRTLTYVSRMAFPSALAFILLGCGLLCVQPARGLMSVLTGTGTGSTLARRLLPTVILALFILGWLRLVGERAGLYDSAFGAVMLITSGLVIFVALIWRAAVGLNHMDAERLRAVEELRRSHEELERKVAERTAALGAQSARLQEQARALDLAHIFIRDLDDRIIFWNTGAQALYGWTKEEVLGRVSHEVTQTVFPEPLADIKARVFSTGEWEGELTHVRRDGTRVIVASHWVLHRDETGQPVAFLEVNNDITERKRIEHEREELLKREQEARREAEDASRLKDEFLATVSHELRTPLTAVLGWARLLHTDTLDEATTRRALETIERNARAQVQLIEDLLDVSRIVAGKLQLNARPIKLAPVIAAAAESVRPAAEVKGIRLVVELDKTAPPVAGDAERLQQVVWNLLSNAIKFTPQGGEVQVDLSRHNGTAEIVVRDTGQGIAPDFLPYIFERFRQADTSSTRTHGGLGLGLTIVRHLVELHGGAVVAESAGIGHGAVFTVRLPLTTTHDSNGSHDEADALARKPAQQTTLLAGLRVLVVDDEQDALDVLRLTLVRSGARVMTAATVAAALELLAQDERPDLLISDIGMPNADGYTLIRTVRAREAELGLPRLPAIALTAYARPQDRAQVLAAGFDTHLAKPFEPTTLLALLTEQRLRTKDEG